MKLNMERLEWIAREYDAIEHPNIQDRLIALVLLAAEVDEWLESYRKYYNQK